MYENVGYDGRLGNCILYGLVCYKTILGGTNVDAAQSSYR